MKIPTFTALLLLATGPIALLANASTDRKIEDAAQDSPDYKTVLEEHVAGRVSEGAVTLPCVAPDGEARAQAADTVETHPGVTAVTIQLPISSIHP